MRKPLDQIVPADLLTRPQRSVEGRKVDCEYYVFNLRFNVSERAIGSIPVDAVDALAEFERVVATALASNLTRADAERSHLDAQLRSLERQQGICDALHDLAARVHAAENRAFARYHAQRDILEAEGGRARHEQIIEALLDAELN